MNYYFDMNEMGELKSIKHLLDLNVKKRFYNIGSTTVIDDITSKFSFPYETNGLFRGQIESFPLIPRCYRDKRLIPDADENSIEVFSQFNSCLSKYRKFCLMAERQHRGFPPDVSGRMSIAQHFGVPTPLLDWSHNILTAVFFCIREIFANKKFENDLTSYIYHIIDERTFVNGLKYDDIKRNVESAYIRPPPIDRRIERQQGVFTYHPHPAFIKRKISVNVYRINFEFAEGLIQLLNGLGFTEEHYFPDYSGLAQAVNKDFIF